MRRQAARIDLPGLPIERHCPALIVRRARNEDLAGLMTAVWIASSHPLLAMTKEIVIKPKPDD